MAGRGTATAAPAAQWPASIRATAAPKRGYDFLSPTSPEMSSDHSGHSIHSIHSLTLSSFSSAATSPPVDLDHNNDDDDDDDASFEHSSLLPSAGQESKTSATGPGSDNLTRRSATQRLSQLLGSDATTAPVPERSISHSSTSENHNNHNINRTSYHSDHSTTVPLATAAATLVRPRFIRSSRGLEQQPPPPPPPVIEPAIVRTASTREKLPLLHPAPDTNPRARSGAYVGNIAQLENTAEQFSRSGSIEIAIREAHQELKRSDSRRSSILAASVRSLALENGSRSGSLDGAEPTSAPPHSLAFSRQSSVVELNSVARTGGYSPSGYVMSPAHSLSSARLRSASKTRASGSLAAAPADSLAPADDGFPFLSRHGPGKASVRSTHSGKMSLPEIVECEPPMTLTLEALDEADRIIAEGEDHDDDDTIRATAHQHIDFDFDGPEDPLDLTPQAEQQWLPQQPIPPSHGAPAPRDYLGYGTAQQQPHLPNPLDHQGYQPAYAAAAGGDPLRPATSGSGETYDQAQPAFGDFDGVHYNPEHVDFPEIREPELQHAPKPRGPPPPRPKSYFDQNSGQQMLYYPARVPAMLNLPPKLSKNPKGGAERTKRRTQILSAMPEATRQSRVWLPDPLLDGSDLGSPLMDMGDKSASDSGRSPLATTDGSESQPSPMFPVDSATNPSASSTSLPANDQQQQAAPMPQYRRPPRLTDADRRKSRMSNMDALPSQLRASVFFALPATSPQIEVKNGSAMDTLESILDAAATAPVSAFTDHAYAGKLGSEVYGPEKKRKKKKRTKAKQQQQANDPYAAAQLRASAALETKQRGSFLSLIGHSRKNSEPLDVAAAERRSMLGADGIANDEPSPGLSRSGELLSPGLSEGGGALAPDEDEGEDEEEEDDYETDDEDDEDKDAYVGPPTTLLAELQLRKQQQKLRTRPVHKAFPNGLHSTLLELDAVAEVERRARRGKKVNLAWEDPALNPDTVDDDEDEDVPLGMLFAARAAAAGTGPAGPGGPADISAVAAELNRPLGLMEKKALDDNEPLSRRRDRLQGRDPGISMYLGAAHPGLGAKRQSTLTLTPTIAALHSAGQISPGAAAAATATPPPPEEIEGETLGERRRRLKGQDDSEELPRARPVSTAFTAELLGQFGDPEEEEKEAKKKAAAANGGKENAPPGDEEEETLGQRRKRLQAEREARDREMMMGGGGTNLPVNGPTLQALTGSDRLSKRLSMADVLAAHPRGLARGAADPREVERRWREEEALRAARDRDAKMARLRSQMPTNMSATSLGGGVYKPGGFLGGRFNDGTGGGIGAPPTTYVDGPGVGPWANGIRSSVALSGIPFGAGGGGPAAAAFAGYPTAAMPPPMAMGMGVGIPAQHGQPVDMVERWRQGVSPS